MTISKDITEIKVKLGKVEQKLDDLKCTMKKCPEPEKHTEINTFMASTKTSIRMFWRINMVVLSALTIVVIGVSANNYFNGGG